MHDPHEGITPEGMIRTGIDAANVAPGYRDVLDAVAERVPAGRSVYVYGSVATGQANPPHSDVDILTIGVEPGMAAAISSEMTQRFEDVCRAVEIAPAGPGDFEGERDAAYGGRVFLHHYCAHVAGPDLDRATEPFPADARAARGLNGDIGIALDGWRSRLADGSVDGRRVARKTLHAVAGLVSVHDRTWTTDRESAARRWAEVRPELSDGLARLADWANALSGPAESEIAEMLDTTVVAIADDFAERIGLWAKPSEGG